MSIHADGNGEAWLERQSVMYYLGLTKKGQYPHRQRLLILGLDAKRIACQRWLCYQTQAAAATEHFWFAAH